MPAEGSKPSFLRYAVPVLAFAPIPLSLAALFYGCLAGPNALAGFEHRSIWYPFMGFAQESFHRDGVLPFWLPGLFCGIPFGESIFPFIYHPMDLVGWLTNARPVDFYLTDTIIHLLLSAAGAAFLARAYGLSWVAAGTAAAAYMLGGILMTQVRVGIENFVRGAALLPWVAAFHARWAGGGGNRNLAGAAFCTALMALSGAHQLVCYAFLALILLSFFPERGNGVPRAAAGAGIIFACAAVLAAVSLLPSIRYYLLSLRADPSLPWLRASPLEFSELPLLLVPDMTGFPDRWRVFYLGLAATGLALVGARRPGTRKWSILMAAALLLAVAPRTPLGSLLSRIPLYGSLRVSIEWLIVAQLSLAILAAHGADSIRANPGLVLRKASAAFLALGLFILVVRGVFGLAYHPGPLRLPARQAVRDSALCAAAGAALFAGGLHPAAASVMALAVPWAVAADLLRWPMLAVLPRQDVEGESPAEDQLAGLLRATPGVFRTDSNESPPVINARITAGLEWVTGFHTAPMHRFTQFYLTAFSRKALPSILPWMNARFIVASSPSAGGDTYEPVSEVSVRDITAETERRMLLLETGDYAPRCYLATRLAQASSLASTLDYLAARPPSSRWALPDSGAGITSAFRPAGGEARLVKRTPNEVAVSVTVRGDGYLVLNDSFYPAWESYIDGTRTRIIRTNWIFRGVQVPAGRHEVVFIFNSTLFRTGLWISFLAAAALAAFLALASRGHAAR